MYRLTRLALTAGCLAVTAGAVATAPASADAAAKTKHAPSLNSASVVLELSHSAGLASFVKAVSDPQSPRYRHYADFDTLVQRYGATKKTKKSTLRWLSAKGLTGEVGPSGQYLMVHTTQAEARAAFASTPSASAAAASHGSWDAPVPAGLNGAVTGVSVIPAAEGTATPRATTRQATPLAGAGSASTQSGTPAGCAEGQNAGPEAYKGLTPNQYLTAYGHSTLHKRGLTGKGIRVAVVEIDGFNPSDIQTFAKCFGHRVPPLNVKAVGQKALNPPGGETTLDLEILTAAAPGLEAIDVFEGSAGEGALLDTIAATISDQKTRPDVISISLDECEADYYSTVVAARAVNGMFAIAAGSGISTLVATGDQGSSNCTNANGGIPVLSASVPSTSQYVTAVGGTNISLNPANEILDQVVWNDTPQLVAATSGGSSVLFSRPWWQNKTLPSGLANDVMRVTPDISAMADVAPGYAVYCTAQSRDCQLLNPAGGWATVGGTSAATPLMAAGIALANEAAAKRGQRPLGLINPLVYQLGMSKAYPKVMWDVTTGSSDVGAAIPVPTGTGQPLGCCSASKGFDPASGWGSLKVAAFSDAALGFGARTAKSAAKDAQK
jgi:subtilase family serine protease